MKKRHVIWLFILVVFAASSAYADNQPKRVPFSLWLPHFMADGAPTGFSAFGTIPAGKVFVIESFSVEVGLPPGQKLTNLFLEFSGEGEGAQGFFIPVFLTGSCSDCANGGPADIYTNAQNIRLYVKDSLRSSASRDKSNVNGIGYFSVFVYGYLISSSSNTLSP